ncbi:MAG TPA: hypothetical protein VF230_00375, partial [Acidimicrobiales bacterium]
DPAPFADGWLLMAIAAIAFVVAMSPVRGRTRGALLTALGVGAIGLSLYEWSELIAESGVDNFSTEAHDEVGFGVAVAAVGGLVVLLAGVLGIREPVERVAPMPRAARGERLVLGAVIATSAATLLGSLAWTSLSRDDGLIFVCENAVDCARELAGDGPVPSLPRDDGAFTFVSGDVTRGPNGENRTMTLEYASDDVTFTMLVADTARPNVAQRPAASELTTTPGGRLVRTSREMVAHWDDRYLYVLIWPGPEDIPTDEAFELVDLLDA